MLQIEITTSSAMASYRWISAIQQQSICDVLSDAMTAQRLDYDYSHCTKEQFFANIPYCKVKNRLSSVAVIAMWTDRKTKISRLKFVAMSQFSEVRLNVRTWLQHCLSHYLLCKTIQGWKEHLTSYWFIALRSWVGTNTWFRIITKTVIDID